MYEVIATMHLSIKKVRDSDDGRITMYSQAHEHSTARSKTPKLHSAEESHQKLCSFSIYWHILQTGFGDSFDLAFGPDFQLKSSESQYRTWPNQRRRAGG